jgi:hypothetical protein
MDLVMTLTLKAGNTVFITPSGFDSWMLEAKPGDKITYAVGTLTSKKIGSEELNAVARMARLWSDHEKIDLVQRRRGVDSYEYIAIRRDDNQPREQSNIKKGSTPHRPGHSH